jgi:hypothetical protein
MTNPWFKFFGGEWLSDPKRDQLTAVEQNCLTTLLCYANISNLKGKVPHITEKSLMIKSGIVPGTPEWDVTVGVIKKFETLGIVKIVSDIITVRNWQKRQETSLSGAERAKRFRDKNRNETVTQKSDESNARREEKREEKKREEKKKEDTKATPAHSTRIFFETILSQTEPQYTSTIADLVDKTGLSESHVKSEVQKFALYWTEPTKSGKSLRWEKQDAFEIRRRLATWFRNAEEFSRKP